MLDFWNENIMRFMWAFLIIICFLFIIGGYKNKALIYRNQISFSLAIGQLVIWLISISIYFSRLTWYRLFFTDLCPFVSFVSIIIFFTNKTKYYKAIMPWFFIGSTVTMLGGGAHIFSDPKQIPGFIEHSIMFMQGFFTYLWIDKYQKRDYYLVTAFPALLIFWILIIGFIPWQVTGDDRWVVFSTALFQPAIGPTTIINENGIIEGVGAYAILAELGIPYPIPTFIFYTLALFIAYGIVINKNYFPRYYKKIKKIRLKHSK